MKLIVPISGGKDSQATLLWAVEKYGINKITAVFCDTGWEHSLTYEHLQYLIDKIKVEYLILQSEKYQGFVDLAKKKKRFPSAAARFCTVELKIKPMIDYILSLQEHIIIFQGIRADESNSRSKMNEVCRYFKYYFEPYRTNEMIVKKFKETPPKTEAQKAEFKKAFDRLSKGYNDEKYHTYRKAEVFDWCKKYSDEIQRPFFYETANNVITYSLARNIAINPLYYYGLSRVGCFPCKNANKLEMKIITTKFPETIDKIKEAERQASGTFFSSDYIPKSYHTGFDPKSGKTICKIEDVIRYVQDKNSQLNMLEGLGLQRSCESSYFICE